MDDSDSMELAAVDAVRNDHKRPLVFMGTVEPGASPLEKPKKELFSLEWLKDPKTIAMLGFGLLAVILLIMLIRDKKED